MANQTFPGGWFFSLTRRIGLHYKGVIYRDNAAVKDGHCLTRLSPASSSAAPKRGEARSPFYLAGKPRGGGKDYGENRFRRREGDGDHPQRVSFIQSPSGVKERSHRRHRLRGSRTGPGPEYEGQRFERHRRSSPGIQKGLAAGRRRRLDPGEDPLSRGRSGQTGDHPSNARFRCRPNGHLAGGQTPSYHRKGLVFLPWLCYHLSKKKPVSNRRKMWMS